jgi:hypothetical protein
MHVPTQLRTLSHVHAITLCNTGVTFPIAANTTSTNTDSAVEVTVNGATVTEGISVTAGSVPQECSVKLPSETAGAVFEVALLVAADSSAHRYYMFFNYIKLHVFSINVLST